MTSDIEAIRNGDSLLALVLRSDFTAEGIRFFTPPEFSQQLAYMNRPAGYRIAPHVHTNMQREVLYTQEVLFIRRGKVKVNFFDQECKYLCSCILVTGDVIMLASGGHGFEILEPTEIIEVKQGPYAGDQDKVRFEVKE